MDMSWPYIAGFFDGEGSIGVAAHATGRKAGIYIAQSGRMGQITLIEIQVFLKSQGIDSAVFQTGKAGVSKRTKPSYRLAVNGFTGTTKFLKAVLPYIRIKRSQAQDVLRYNVLFPNLFKSPLAAAWRREKQLKSVVRGAAWHALYDGRKIGRPRGSLDKGPRRKRVA